MLSKGQKISIALKGRKQSQETKEKIRRSLTGRPPSLNTRIAISEANRRRKWKMSSRKKLSRSNTGKTYDKSNLCQESRQRLREGAWKTQGILTNKARITAPERKMIEILNDLGVDFERNKIMSDIRHTYPADFYLPEYHTIIEVDGQYWHKYPVGTPIDVIREIELSMEGYIILRFWDNKFDINTVKESLHSLHAQVVAQRGQT